VVACQSVSLWPAGGHRLTDWAKQKSALEPGRLRPQQPLIRPCQRVIFCWHIGARLWDRCVLTATRLCYNFYCGLIWKALWNVIKFSVLVNMSTSCTPVLCNVLHWLPVTQRIQFKIATLTFDCVSGSGPAYFSSNAYTVADNSGRPGLHWESVAICLFHEPEQLSSEGGASSSQLQLSCLKLTATHATSPSLPAHESQSSWLILSGWPFTDLSSENYWRDWTELNFCVCDSGAGIDCWSITSRLCERSSPVGAWQLRRQR